MKTITIHDEDLQQVINLLLENDVPFGVGDTSKAARLLKATPRHKPRNILPMSGTPRRKEPRADLEILAKSGAIKSGELLELRDYQGRTIEGCEASVAGTNLVYNGKQYSMSNLAQRLLARHGYKKTAVRGPAHWFTKQGRSVKELWEELA